MSASRHPANVTDAMRLVGAYCVVWYHNPFYWNLHEHTQWVDAMKLLILGWSMPFFYTTSARFAFAGKDVSRHFQRVVRLVALIGFYTVLYELLHWNLPTSLASHCFGSSTADCSPGLVFETLRNVGNTPGYYLSDLIVMHLLAMLVAARPFIGKGLAIVGGIALFAGWIRLGGLFLNPLGLFGLSAALGYIYLVAPRLSGYRRVSLAPVPTAAMALGFVLLWGVANLLQAQNQYWNDTSNILLFLPLLLLFMALSDLIRPEGRLTLLVSEWGRKYAFGIFIFHQLCFDLLAPRVAQVTMKLVQGDNALTLYVLSSIVISAAATIVTAIIRKAAPVLLTP
ncbi:hypothetical protein I5R65_11945 [Herbaspirillum sp. AP02]|uniref:hypothetical protein n=1 Tax=unclassified Herbaspirillum TaxID=2624150 RepID=UPI0015DB351E|nr:MULTISPECIES: hypothetical protein [unclassified Herbaspirillum]MBG7620178.1 hypothetical protein [Herbaspirillum sp. AP02]NZD67642.1 hypothetical protein [Herbaspirillum sp. AP21]